MDNGLTRLVFSEEGKVTMQNPPLHGQMSWQCPQPSHSRPLRGPCHPNTSSYPASSELEWPTAGPLCQPRKNLAARPQDWAACQEWGTCSPGF